MSLGFPCPLFPRLDDLFRSLCNGKLKTHTMKPTVGMFIPQMRNGQEKMVSVSVVEEDRIIYISKDMFKLYEKGLSEPEGIELRRTF